MVAPKNGTETAIPALSGRLTRKYLDGPPNCNSYNFQGQKKHMKSYEKVYDLFGVIRCTIVDWYCPMGDTDDDLLLEVA